MSGDCLDSLKTLAAFPGDEERQKYVFENPVLLSADLQRQMHARLGSVPEVARAPLQHQLGMLEGMREALEGQVGRFPLALGPIEGASARLLRGEISESQARSEAAKAGAEGRLSAVYVAALCSSSERLASLGNWQQGLRLADLILAAVGSVPSSGESRRMREDATICYLATGTAFLVGVPDGRVYRRALASATALLEARDADAWATRPGGRGEVLFQLGVLHLDPYTAERSDLNFGLETSQWLQRLWLFVDPAELARVPEEELSMPEPGEALRAAERYLTEAAALQSGHTKGLTLKALAQAVQWQAVATKTPADVSRITAIGREALDLLDASRAPETCIALLSALSGLGQPVERAVIDRVFAISPDEHVRRRGVYPILDCVRHAPGVLLKEDPAAALALHDGARALVRHHGDEEAKVAYWQQERMLMDHAFATMLPEHLDPGEGSLSDAARRLREAGDAEGWDRRTLAARLVRLASLSLRTNEEDAALELLEDVREIAPVFATERAETLTFLGAVLWLGVGSNRVQASEAAGAIDAYTESALRFLELGLTVKALDGLLRIDDLAGRPGVPVVEALVLSLARLAMPLEAAAGEETTRIIQGLVKKVVAQEGRFNPQALLMLLEFAKGFRFSHALFTGLRDPWREDQEGAALLDEIRQLEAEVPEESTEAVADAGIGEEMLLAAYARPEERPAGQDPATQLENLRHRFDAHLNERLLAVARSDRPLFLGIPELQALLGPRSVLANFYLGRSARGNATIGLILASQEEVRAFGVDLGMPDGTVVLSADGRESVVSYVGLHVQSVRKNLLEDPGERLVDDAAAASLESDLRMFFGHAVEALASLKAAGKDHLCIAPTDALHFYPFHLLGPPGKPLADDWIVTYLPNLHLLFSGGRPVIRRRRERSVVAIGLGYEGDNPFGLEPIPEAAAEATDVAAVFGARPILDAAATKAAVAGALQTSRWVHLSAHGRHNVVAPSFQCIYLAPDADSDGRLYAHEVLPMDLRGLEVVTLSACETALGRFDRGDNLRGLPASLLIAGASTLIGTLWEVNADVSRLFFTSLYRGFRDGWSRLDAFDAALRETRQVFPKYWDWGPFYFAGDWL